MNIVQRAIEGDKQSFSELIHEHKEVLYRTAYAYTGNEADAIDIVHECVYKSFLGVRNLREPAFFKTWLTRILINCAKDFLKKKNQVISLDQLMVSERGDKASISADDRLDLQDAITQLEEKYKFIIILKFYQDLTFAEISDILEIPLGTVKTHYYAALKKLRMNLGEECVNE